MSKPGPIEGWEIALASAITFAALLLRVWLIWTAGLEHYDEGVYALSGLGLSDSSWPDRLYPGQSRFSPLTYPLLVAVSFRLLGPSDIAAILPNVVLGTLTVFLLWWVGRRWFGPVAGLSAATLLAASELHISLSRSALTDVSFLLLFLAAVACAVEMADRDSFAWAVLTGLVTGVAWNTKYHGWFVLILSGGAFFVLILRNRLRGWRRPLALWAMSAAVAVCLYLPWALFVSSEPGGYAGLMAYQRTMLQGGWLTNLGEQWGQLAYMDGVVGRVGFAAVILIAFASFRDSWPSRSSCGWLIASLVLLLFFGAFGAATALTLLWLFTRDWRRARYASVVLLAWVALWVSAAPLYAPYLRLVLPLSAAVFLGTGACLQSIAEAGRSAGLRTRCPRSLVRGSGLALGILAAVLGLRSPADPWRAATGFRDASNEIAAVVPENALVIVIGHPEVAFYLRLAGRQALSPEPEPEEWAGMARPAYLVEGVYARRAPKLRNGLAALRGSLETLDSYPIIPKDLRVLDDSRAQKARDYRAAPDARFDLALHVLRPVAP